MDLVEPNNQLSQPDSKNQIKLQMLDLSWAGFCPNNFSEPNHTSDILSRQSVPTKSASSDAFFELWRENSYCILGHYAAADDRYRQSLEYEENIQCPHTAAWTEIYNAWKLILQGQLSDAYKLLYQSREKPTTNQAFFIQLVLAIADCIGQRYHNAEEALTQAPAFFINMQEHLQACSIRLHLAYLYLQTERSDQARYQIQEALTSLRQGGIDYLPHWWHPEIMAQVFAYAIAHGIQPHTAERIFVKYIGQEGKSALYPYLYVEDAAIQRNSYIVYSLFSDGIMEMMPAVSNPRIEQTLCSLLQRGKLRPEGFLSLQQKLITATRRNKPNTALIATFGLYLQRYNRVEIAEFLDLSQATIRNYITALYEIFDLDQQAYDGQRARFRRLTVIAKERGFIN